jgi:hypothetical protein
MTGPRALTMAGLVTDPALVRDLIDGGETLFVEHKETDPRDGLGPTVASFANMLGGWLLIGVDDDRNVVGYAPPGRVDLQDYIRQLLADQIDPMPPFAATTVPIGDATIGVVRIAESSDTPHVTRDGVIYVRNPGGKQRVTDHRDILALARRGEGARVDAARRQYGLPLIEHALRVPERIYGDDPERLDELPAILEWIVRATPYTVTGAFADRALSRAAGALATEQLQTLLPMPIRRPYEPETWIDAQARGLQAFAGQRTVPIHLDAAIDAGGVVAVRSASRGQGALFGAQLSVDKLRPIIRVAAAFWRASTGWDARRSA